MNIFIGFILLSVGVIFGYILCALLSFNGRYSNELSLTTTASSERRPNYLIIYRDNKMIAVYYEKKINWLQKKILKWVVGVDIKELVYDI